MDKFRIGLSHEVKQLLDFSISPGLLANSTPPVFCQVLLEKYGGADGLRDAGALEAAAFRPQCGYYNDQVEEAAALLESLLINHPFIDGNKRTAFAAADVFLRLNGIASRPPRTGFMNVLCCGSARRETAGN
jgi:death-on-curing family protein